MKLLELFAGTKSVSKVFEAAGWNCITLDLTEKHKPTILVNILEWDYTVYKPGFFDYIHCSPVCTEYSRALTTRPRRLEEADKLVEKCLAILNYFKPKYFTIENPESLLKDREIMQPMQNFMKRCCYCMYSDEEGTHSYRKPTNIWTNIPWEARPMCSKSTPCKWKAESGVHPKVAQKGPSGSNKSNRRTQDELYSLPPLLPEEWLSSMHQAETRCLG